MSVEIVASPSSEAIPIEFTTIRSTLARGRFKAAEYDRVTSIAMEGRTLELPRPYPRREAYSPQESHHSFHLPESFAKRLGNYVTKHFAREGSTPPKQEEYEFHQRIRNCFSFAIYMSGIDFPTYIYARRFAKYLARSPEPNYTPAAGSVGVIAHPNYRMRTETKPTEPPQYNELSHAYTCITQGEDAASTLCLQVAATGGPLGFTTLENIVETHRGEIPTLSPYYFQNGRVPSAEDIHPYVVRPQFTLARNLYSISNHASQPTWRIGSYAGK